MSKIIIPQELQDKIIDLYVNKQYNRAQIKRELNLTFGDSVIKRVLQEHNINIRTNNGAQKGGRKKQEVSRELQDKIIEAYKKGYGLNKIVNELELPFGSEKVKSILKDNKIKIRNLQEALKMAEMPDLRKYSINDNYSFKSHNGAWLLGFIAADGYLPITNGASNRIAISLARQDRNILEILAKELQYTGPLYDYESSGYPASSLTFTSKKLRKQIEFYGIGNNKTFKLCKLPQLPKEFIIDFIAGFFDGDGSIYELKDKKIGMNITCASQSFLEDIVNFLADNYSIRKVNIHSVERVHTIYDIKYSVQDSFKLGNLFYDNDYIRLPRKKQHFLNIKEKHNIH